MIIVMEPEFWSIRVLLPAFSVAGMTAMRQSLIPAFSKATFVAVPLIVARMLPALLLLQ